METKTLPAFMHDSIGAKTHGSRAAQKHMLYIMREDAMTKFQSEHMPGGERGTSTYFDKLWEKAGMPNSHRIADQFIIALPLELNAQQRHELVHSFMESLGKGRIAWCAAHHDEGKDAHNPHVHILFKDADIDTGRKVIGTTVSAGDVREARENGWKVPPRMTTREMRHAWCDHLNRFMEREGIDIRYDARSYKQRGIDKEPGIHIGPKANALAGKGHDFESQDLQRKDQQGLETIPYSQLDQGSRLDYNEKITEANRRKALEAEHRQERQQGADSKRREQESSRRMTEGRAAGDREGQEKRQLREAQKQARQAMYAEQQHDRDALKAAQKAERDKHGVWSQDLYAKARAQAYQSVKEEHTEKWSAVRAIEDRKQRETAEAALKLEQKAAYKRATDATIAATRPQKDEAWTNMRAEQDRERLELRAQHRSEAAALYRQHNAELNSVHDKWRARSLGGQAHRIEKQLSARQGMVAQQTAAMATLKLHARGGQTGASARDFMERARSEAKKTAEIRALLNSGRDANIRRGPDYTPKRENVGGRPRRSVPGSQANQRTDVAEAGFGEQPDRQQLPPSHRDLFLPSSRNTLKPDQGRQTGDKGGDRGR
jgi:hypothetical protein